MSETLQREDSAVARPPRRWRPRFLGTLFGLVAVFVVMKLVMCRPTEQDCAAVVRNSDSSDGVIVVVCQREYERTRAPATGAQLAHALRRSGNAAAAAALANDLLNTSARGDAFQVLARIAVSQNRLDDAVSAFGEARKAHREQGRRGEIAKDALGLADVQRRRNQFVEALQSLEECIVEAQAGKEPVTQGSCFLASSHVHGYVGYFDAAQYALDRAAPLLPADGDQAWVWYARGNLHQEAERLPERPIHTARAISAFERALPLARRAQNTTLVRSIHLNLAHSLAEGSRTEEAEQHLAEAGLLDLDGSYENERAQLMARISYHRGNKALAYSTNERIYDAITDDDDRIIAALLQTRIALDQRDLAAAERWARRGIEAAEKIREGLTVPELRPWVLATWREPYELLFGILASAGRIEQAVEVFDQWQGRTLLDKMAEPDARPDPTSRLSRMADRVRGLARWLPAAAQASLMKQEERSVLATTRSIDLLALTIADGQVWRITSSRGQLRIDPLGSYQVLGADIDALIAKPSDKDLAAQLGARILPPEFVRNTSEPLYVVLDPRLVPMPFVALRQGELVLVDVRPVLRMPRLPAATSCPAPPAISSPVVLADSFDDLPEARSESSTVASLFKTTPLVGAAATSEALFAAKRGALIHAAVHAGEEGLKLRDRTVSGTEISASKLSPVLVVLAGCSTTRAFDPELLGSLATGFLVSGATRVIATLRPVSDGGAGELTRRFYQAGGADDPVRTLARIQSELALTDNKDWPFYAVFAGDLCSPSF